MKKEIFDLITSPFSLFDNPLYNCVAMFIVGVIAFKIAFKVVGDLDFRGTIGSIAHWTIRFVVFAVVWFVFLILINIINFIKKNYILIIISIFLLSILYIFKKYAASHPNCILNKKIF